MESIGANFNDYCSCCGYRWYRASRPVGELDDIDVRYSKERVAVHYKDGSFVIWTPKRYAKPEPKPFNDLASGNPFIIRCDPVTEESYAVESERIAEATKPRYKAYASECESPEEALLERVRRDHEEYKTVEAIKAEILSAITKTLSDI
jgi:hypothetical protein